MLCLLNNGMYMKLTFITVAQLKRIEGRGGVR